MNCSHFQELLSLYAGRDLDEKQTRLVGGHLQICAECAAAAAEYSETLRMIEEFAPPLFSESVYAGIRQRVLRGIEQECASPTLTQILTNYFRQRTGWAVAPGLLLTIALFAVYFIATRDNGLQIADSNDATSSRQDVDSNARREGQSPNTETKVRDAFPESARPVIPPQGKVTKLTAGRAYRSQRRGHSAAARNHASPGKTVPKAATAFPAASNLAGIPAPDGSESTLRVEMQTRDPNIRIIWFSNLPAKQNSRN